MISDSSPLIFLSKIGKLSLLKDLFREITIPTSVKDEILVEEKPEANTIKMGLEEKWIKIVDPKKILELNLGKGESHAISLALEKKDSLIIDDQKAIRAAEALNVDILRTTSIIFIALKNKKIDKKEALELVNSLIKNGYYLAPKYYLEIVEKLTE